LIENGKEVLRDNYLNSSLVVFFIIAILQRLEILLVDLPINCHFKNAFFITLVKFLGNTSIIGASKVAFAVEVGRVVGEVVGLKSFLQ